MKITTTSLAFAALAITLSAAPTLAFDYHGYLRGGPGFNTKGGTQACFALPDSNFKARLGNECDRYGEFLLGENAKVAGLEWRAEFMPAFYEPLNLGKGNASLFVQQAWVGVRIPDLGGAQFWAGRRYFARHDVHSLDWFYWNLEQGNNAFGIEDINLGFGKGAFTLVAVEPTGKLDPANVLVDNLRGSVRGIYLIPGVRVSEIAVNPNGKLEVGVDVALAQDQKTAAGVDFLGQDRAGTSALFTVEHTQDKFLGGSNKLTFQYGSGALAKSSGDGPGNVTLQGATTKDSQWRVIEHLVVEPTPEVSGALVLVYQDISGNAASAIGDKGRQIFSAELRPAYQITEYFKLAADVFYQSISYKDSGVSSQNLTKLTLAPTFVAGRGYYARPELRAYVTYAAWNDAAGPGAGQGAFGTATSGTSIGVQGEIWF